MNVEYKFNLNDRVETPFETKGIITMLGFDDGGKVYYVKTATNSEWFKESELSHC